MGEERDLMATFIDQMDGLTAVGQSIADGSIIGIDGDGGLSRIAAAEEDDVRARGNEGIGREEEVVA